MEWGLDMSLITFIGRFITSILSGIANGLKSIPFFGLGFTFYDFIMYGMLISVSVVLFRKIRKRDDDE